MPNISHAKRVPVDPEFVQRFEVCPHCGQKIDKQTRAAGHMTLPKLEQVRKEHGWARGELAIEIGTSPAHIWRIETQGTMVKRHTARKLADVLEVDLAELTNGGG